MTHECPATGCTLQIRHGMLMCTPHWRLAPHAIRTAVWTSWRDGDGAGTPQHTAAINAAILAVNEKLAQATP